MSPDLVLPLKVSDVEEPLDDTVPQLLWFENEAWLLHLQKAAPCVFLPLPDGFVLPTPTYGPFVFPQCTERAFHDDLTFYIDGAPNGTQAAWGIAVTSHHPDGAVSFILYVWHCPH